MAQITLNSTGVASNGSLVLQSNGTTAALTIDTSQRAAFVAGTAALPAITTTGDTNTGIFFPAADTIAFAEGGVESMRIDSSGALNIGATSTTGKLLAAGTGYNISGNAYGIATFLQDTTTARGVFMGYDSTGQIGTVSAASNGAASNLAFWTYSGSAWAEKARIDSSGNLGIGSTSPIAKLDISGISTSQNGLRLTATSGGQALAAFTTDTSTGEIRIGGTVAAAGAYFPVFYANGSERARIDSSGNLLVGTTSGSTNVINKTITSGTILAVTSNGTGSVDTAYFNYCNATGANLGTEAGLYVQKHSTSGRSINAAGTINASGADYAEYMVKAGDFTIAKGDVCGIDANGQLTNVYADAVSFAVKSTNPSYVGGDNWGANLADADDEAKETVREKYDRVAFAGQVPVNVMGATAGQYIIPMNDNGAIKGEAVSNPTFEQYQTAVGKVIAIESDGRARIIVKVA